MPRFKVAGALIIALMALAIGLLFWLTWNSQEVEQQRTLADTERRAVQLSGAVANRMDVLVRNADFALKQIREVHGTAGPNFAILVKSLYDSFPEHAQLRIGIADEQGRLTYSLPPAPPRFSISDRERFMSHLDGRDRLFIGKPEMTGGTKQWLVSFSRPIIRDGRLRGVAVVSISPAFISQLLAAYELESEDSISLFHGDGTYLARSKGVEGFLGKKLSPERPFMQPGSPENGSYRTTAFSNSAERFFAWERLPDSELVLVVGLDLGTVMAPLEARARREWTIALATSACLLLLAVAVLALLARLARRQQEIQVSEARFRDLTALSSDWYWEQDQDFRTIYLSEGFQQQTGNPPERMLGTKRWDHPGRTPIDSTWEKHRATLEAHHSFRDFEYCREGLDGRLDYFSLSGMPTFDVAGNFSGYHGVGTNITERKRVEESLRERDSRLTGLIDSAMDAIVSIDEAHRVVLFNPAAEAMFGYKASDVLGRNLDMLVPQGARAMHSQHIRDYQKTGVTSRRMSNLGQVSGLRADGTEFPIEASISQVRHNGGAMFTVILRDISERTSAERARSRLEAQLLQAQKMESLGTLAGGIAHDFNNILAAILGNAELARLDTEPGHPVLESLGEIEKASERARDLVKRILAFSRRQPQALRVVDVREVVEDAVKLLRASLPARIELVTQFSPDLPNIQADPTQIHQVIMNLGTNAFHAIGDGSGRIEFSVGAENVEGGVIRVNLPRGSYVRMSVTDTGRGMDEAIMGRIFDPFFTTKAPGEGTGLGLSVVNGIVNGHGGSISVYSQPGRGSTFHVYIPAIAGNANAEVARLPVTLQGSGERILFLDDEEALVALATRLLGRLGYVVRGVSQPAQALQAFRDDPDAFDLFITDYNMPGTSGLEVSAEILRVRPGFPVVLASGYITEDLRAKALACGIREVLYKPISVEDLAAAIGRLCPRKS